MTILKSLSFLFRVFFFFFASSSSSSSGDKKSSMILSARRTPTFLQKPSDISSWDFSEIKSDLVMYGLTKVLKESNSFGLFFF